MEFAAALAGLITLADVAVAKGLKFYSLAKNAMPEIKKLSIELAHLSGALSSLEKHVKLFDGRPGQQIGGSSPSLVYVDECKKCILEAEAVLKKCGPADTSTWENVKKSLRWPLSVSETKELVARVERVKKTILMATQADQMEALCEVLSGQENVIQSLDRLEKQQQRSEEMREEERRANHQSALLEWFTPYQSYKHFEMKRTRTPGTAEWFRDCPEYIDWLGEPNSALWFDGIPGAGKSVLTSAIIEDLRCLEVGNNDTALAYFYIEYSEQDSHSLHTLAGSLLRQLGQRKPECLDVLSAFHGLDESNSDPLERLSILDFVATLGKAKMGSIKVIATSRRIPDIEAKLDFFNQVRIAASSTDVKLYVAAELEKRMREENVQYYGIRIQDPNLKEEIIQTLVDKADGMFQWVRCQMDALSRVSGDENKRIALQNLPRDLPETYRRILRPIDGKQDQMITRKFLIVFPSFEKHLDLCVDLVANFCQCKSLSLKDILILCSSLVKYKDGDINYSHFTVLEFLKSGDEEDQWYHLPDDLEVETALEIVSYIRSGGAAEFMDREAELSLADFGSDKSSSSFLLGKLLDRARRSPFSNGIKIPRVEAALQENFHPENSSTFQGWFDFAIERLHRRIWTPKLGLDHIWGFRSATTKAEVAERSQLHVAVILGFDGIALWLIENCKVDVNQKLGSQAALQLGFRLQYFSDSHLGPKLGRSLLALAERADADLETVMELFEDADDDAYDDIDADEDGAPEGIDIEIYIHLPRLTAAFRGMDRTTAIGKVQASIQTFYDKYVLFGSKISVEHEELPLSAFSRFISTVGLTSSEMEELLTPIASTVLSNIAGNNPPEEDKMRSFSVSDVFIRAVEAFEFKGVGQIPLLSFLAEVGFYDLLGPEEQVSVIFKIIATSIELPNDNLYLAGLLTRRIIDKLAGNAWKKENKFINALIDGETLSTFLVNRADQILSLNMQRKVHLQHYWKDAVERLVRIPGIDLTIKNSAGKDAITIIHSWEDDNWRSRILNAITLRSNPSKLEIKEITSDRASSASSVISTDEASTLPSTASLLDPTVEMGTDSAMFVKAKDIIDSAEMTESSKCDALRDLFPSNTDEIPPGLRLKLLAQIAKKGLVDCFEVLLPENLFESGYTDENGSTLLHLLLADIDPDDNQLYFVRRALDFKFPRNLLIDRLGHHPLHLAASRGTRTAVDLVYSFFSQHWNVVPGLVFSALANPNRQNLEEILDLLSHCGYSFSEVSADGCSPLQAAIISHPPWVAECLLKYANIEGPSDREIAHTPVGLSLANKKIEHLKLLLQKGADIYRRDSKGMTYWHLIMQGGNAYILDLFLRFAQYR
ncbi:hypothetical protein ABW19_dt0200431 [Dactylella cylindrospora]|nr:hypothetical protein ABW19_dt0200431 [Dactylella cylindrospora]